MKKGRGRKRLRRLAREEIQRSGTLAHSAAQKRISTNRAGIREAERERIVAGIRAGAEATAEKQRVRQRRRAVQGPCA